MSSVNFLQHFPPEIWALLVSYLPGEQLGRLKLTGSMIIWKKITSINVVKSVILGTDFLNFKRWPAFLNELSSVEHFSLNNTEDSWCRGWHPTIDQIPWKLKTLNILISRHLTANFFQRCHQHLSFPKHYAHLESISAMLPWASEYPWTCAFQNVTKLSCRKYNCVLPLPTSLTHFEVVKIKLKTAETIPHFPPQLQSINAVELVGVADIVPHLPSSMTHLSAFVIYDARGTRDPHPSWLCKLPPNITSLSGPGLRLSDSGYFERSPELFPCLPNRLTDFEASLIPSEIWSFLPPTLTKFKSCCPGVDQPSSFRTIPVHLLPRSLLKLKLEIRRPVFIDFGPDSDSPKCLGFPPNLTVLDLFNAQLSSQAVQRLPSSLTFLSTSYFDPTSLQYVPSGLKEFKFWVLNANTSYLSSLPKSLVDLSIECPISTTKMIDPFTGIETNSANMVIQYPDYASNGVDASDDLDGSDYLPSIRSLRLLRFTKLQNSCLNQQILSQLETLIVPESLKLTDSLIPRLSRYLTTLNASCAKITGKAFGHLPKTLTFLNLSSSSEIQDGDIQHLPRVLEVLILKAVDLTILSLPHFPRTLCQLKLWGNKLIPLTKEAEAALPFKLRHASEMITETFRTDSWSICNGQVKPLQNTSP